MNEECGKAILRRGNNKCKNSEVEKCLRTVEITLQKDECHNEACIDSSGLQNGGSLSAFAYKSEETRLQSVSMMRGWIVPTWQEPREVRQSQDWLQQCLCAKCSQTPRFPPSDLTVWQ